MHIRIGGHHIPKSPFRVNVASDLDTSKVLAKGPGLEPHGVVVGRAAKFEVFAFCNIGATCSWRSGCSGWKPKTRKIQRFAAVLEKRRNL